jgi:hypothetical protein
MQYLRAVLGEWIAAALAGVIITIVIVWFLHDPGAMDNAEHAAKVIAILAGGVWVLYQFLLRRAFESTLSLDVTVTAVPSGNLYRAFVEIAIANTGNRRIYSAKKLSEKQKTEYEASIEYPCDLQIRNVGAPNAKCFYWDWWAAPEERLAHLSRNDHVSVLSEFSLNDRTLDFFMEPGEKYRLGHLFELPAGYYAAKVVFVGARAGASEYWSRIFFFSIPDRPSA